MTKKEWTPEELQKLAAGIRLVAMDVDGTLTDGGIQIGNDGECFKRFNCRDGLGISTSVRHGLKIAIVTGRESRIIRIRAKEVGVDSGVMTGVQDKAAALAALARLHHLELRETAFLGDDLNDLPALTRAGLAACPADAVPEVRERCQFVSAHKGGDSAAREFLEFLWKAKGQWDTIVQEYVEMGRGDRQ